MDMDKDTGPVLVRARVRASGARIARLRHPRRHTIVRLSSSSSSNSSPARIARRRRAIGPRVMLSHRARAGALSARTSRLAMCRVIVLVGARNLRPRRHAHANIPIIVARARTSMSTVCLRSIAHRSLHLAASTGKRETSVASRRGVPRLSTHRRCRLLCPPLPRRRRSSSPSLVIPGPLHRLVSRS